MYTCGPTVYDYAHIGNLRAYIFSDIAKRVLQYRGFSVKHIINITDVGHLVHDSDDGEDKMSAGLLREGKELNLENMYELGEKYTKSFIDDLKTLHVLMPFAYPRASDNIQEQIAFITSLKQKGYAYNTSDGVYFDTAKFKAYGALGLPGVENDSAHSRLGAHAEKHDQRDFALWKFNKNLGWEASWGKGFPGWHIECTAMATKYLGKHFDIHTGGVDHIAIHHNNEIAQAEAVSNKRFANFWMHGEFITVEGKRIGKSEGNAIQLYQLKERGISPIAYRYLLLTTHYRSLMNFTWESLQGAATALQRAKRHFADLPVNGGKVLDVYREKFEKAVSDDLDTPKAVAVLWELLKDDSVLPRDKRATVLNFDQVLGLGFKDMPSEMRSVPVSVSGGVSEEVTKLLEEREKARNDKNWARSDELRDILLGMGFSVEDTPDGVKVVKL